MTIVACEFPNDSDMAKAVDAVFNRIEKRKRQAERKQQLDTLYRAYAFTLTPRPREWRNLPTRNTKLAQRWIPADMAHLEWWEAKKKLKRQWRAQLMNNQRNRCLYCGELFTNNREVSLDHIIPNALVRTWEPRNLAATCKPCNLAKADRIPVVLLPLLAALVWQTVRFNTAPAERSLVPYRPNLPAVAEREEAK